MLTTLMAGAICLASHSPTSYTPPPMMIRKNVKYLSSTELQGLRDAVAAMQALPPSDPCSWTFQANIHYNMCNHTVSYWLPWHRMYLYYFEKILVGHSGGKLKGLPYWDYTLSTETTFPSKFYPTTYTSGSSTFPNPLYYTPRSNVTSSSFSLNYASTNPAAANSNLVFNGFSGSLQGAPHNYVHIAIGGSPGMGDFHSPMDPVFWSHHAVLDRQWEKWLALGGGRANPTFDSTWMNTSFTFYDYDNGCQPATLKVQDVLSPTTQLNYKYVDPIRIKIWPIYWKWIYLYPLIHFPIPRDYGYGYGPVRYPIDLDPADRKGLRTAQAKTSHQINVVLNFHVSKGENSLAPFEMSVTPAGGRSVRLTTFSVFGVRHQQMEGHSHGEMDMFQLTLPPKASADFLAALRRGKAQLSFAPMMKDIRKQANAQALQMSLQSMEVMEAVPVDKNGKRVRG